MPRLNDPSLWRAHIPHPASDSHKYTRGHAVIFGGARLTGAARLAALAAMRAGAGACTLVVPAESAALYRAGAPHIMVEELTDPAAHLSDPHRNAILIGPGGEGDVRPAIHTILETARPAVLDAAALTIFEDEPANLFNALHPSCILTPHEGEFTRLFGEIPGTRLDKAEKAARAAGAILLLKGAETIIAAPGIDPVINNHATPYLATAGAGDVLAGLITGFLAQSMPPFLAACAAAWIHGESALRFGPGLISPDIIAGIPAILKDLT